MIKGIKFNEDGSIMVPPKTSLGIKAHFKATLRKAVEQNISVDTVISGTEQLRKKAYTKQELTLIKNFYNQTKQEDD